MNKTLKLALGMVLMGGFIGSAMAQDQFPDVPENHWAYEALANMKKNGLLVGYPDGLFRGARPATRYEMAVAIHATYQYLKNITDGLSSQIEELKGKQGPDMSGIREALEALQKDVAAMKGWGDDIANLKRMAATFEKELASLGVDVEAMKKDLKDLNDRVTKLEKNALPITVHGDVNFFVTHGKGTSGRFGLGTDGALVGANPDGLAGGRASGLGDGLSVFHEANLKIAGTNEEGPKWHAILSVGNLMNGWGGGTAGATPGQGTTRNDEAGTNIVFREFVAEFDSSLIGQGFSAKVGRQSYKIGKYLYQRPDTNPYYSDEFDNGAWTMDGVNLGFNFGSAKLNVLFGRTDGRLTNQGYDVAGVTAGAFNFGRGSQNIIGGYGGGNTVADTTFGAHLNVPLSDKGSVDLAYLIHSQNSPVNAGAPGMRDNVHVFGGQVNYQITDAIKFNAGYSQSNIFNGKKSVVTRDNFAWNLMATYEAERWGLSAGYREIQPNFGAAGDWGRIGAWWNPTDIKSIKVGAHFDVTENLSLWGSGEWASGLGKTYKAFNGGPTVTGLRTDDRADSYKIGLDYKMENGWNWMLGAELVDFRMNGLADRGTQRWYTLGLGYNLSETANFKFMWQISDHDARTSGMWAAPGNATGRYTGNLITTQFTIKF